MKIKRIHLISLHNDEYWQFITRLADHIKASGAAAIKIEALHTRFVELYGQLDAAYKKIVKSALSADIDAADRARDEVFRGMKDVVASALRHFKPEVKQAARRVKIVLDGYGDVTALGKSAQTAAVTNLLGDLADTKHANDCAMLDLIPWIGELDKRNIAVERLMETRFDEATARTDLSMREVRLAMDALYGQIVFRVESLQEVLGTEPGAPWRAFIEVMNTIVEYTDNIVAQRRGRLAAEKAEKEQAEADAAGMSVEDWRAMKKAEAAAKKKL
ncbi:MAG: DUF6261 family protein [Alistipes sp.]|jgi:hypothetical protein|nr:DUF6261 family protein [Alistipes sp.]